MLSEPQILRLAEQLLGAPIDTGGFAPCPGAECHTTPGGRRDFRIFVGDDGLPHGSCFHASCQAARDTFFSRLYREIRLAERAANPAATVAAAEKPLTTTPPPQKPKTTRPVLDRALAAQIAAACPRPVTLDTLPQISPIPIPADPARWGELLVDTLYHPGERILIFTSFTSQGDYLRVAGGKNYRLGHRPGLKAYPVDTLPTAGDDGAWYLAAPVTGQWVANPNNLDRRSGQPKLGRRHAACCTRYPYAVLESDDLPPETWLPILAQIADYKIAAVYTSGGKSIHALLALENCNTPADFNRHRTALIQRFGLVGADVAAITPVRLTRLPGVLRLSKRDAHGTPNLQTLLYLAPPSTPKKPLYAQPKRRGQTPQAAANYQAEHGKENHQ